jgi:protein-S-isoprenylcysteine O-methyltransferase Ste14
MWVGVKALVGSGDRIALVMLPAVVVGAALEVADPSLFSVGGPPTALAALSIVVLAVGVSIWAWSVVLILSNVPRHRLITGGPYAWVKHPLYTAVALLVLPWAGFLLNSWIGLVFGGVLYVAARRFAPAEEKELSRSFGRAWDEYVHSVRLGWL